MLNVVGSLMYVMVCTRQDNSHRVGLQYLLKNVDVGLVFKRDDTCNQYVISYVNSDYASDLDKRWSTIGYVLLLQEH